MQVSRKATPILGMAALTALGLAPTPARAAFIATVTPAVTPSGGQFLYTYTVLTSPTSTDGVSEFDLAVSPNAALTAITQPNGFLNLYTPGDSQISYLSTDSSSDIAPGRSGTFSFISPLLSALQPYLLRNLDDNSQSTGQTLAPTTRAIITTPEPSSVAAFGFTGLFAAGLMLKARKRTTIQKGHRP